MLRAIILFYKTYAQLPALRYTLYPFLGLCAALAALHLIAGFTLGRVRPRLTLFLCGAGSYLCIVALPGVRENAYRLFLGAIALELAVHGVCLLLPVSPTARAVSVLLAAMPVAINTSILAERYNGDSVYTTKLIVVSTLLSIPTTALWSMILL